MRSAEDIIKKPFITEKSNADIAEGKYTFVVDVKSTKTEIKMAVEKLFQVRVLKVNTLNYEGKKKRMGVHEGKRADWKKAIVKIDMDPNGEKTKTVRVVDKETGKVKVDEKGSAIKEKKNYTPGSYFDKGGKATKANKKYKGSIEEYGAVQ